MKWMPGELNEQIEIIRETKTPDGSGGFVTTTSVYSSPWAKVICKSGSEKVGQERINASGIYQFVIRFLDGITEKDRIRWNGQDFNIRFIPRVTARDMYIVIDAERGAANAKI